uniref:Uncharacterized protein LOC111099522 n=1 Tax=Crassostrea virginica TaxID=6565 RepID=A0A8B8A7C0_CRAVI|nr:uncharacterized protein LOC111099522 [Crassostrea virginica]
MAVKLSGIASIRVLAIVIFLIDVVVLAAVLLVLWNMAGEKNETCSKLCLPCADDKGKICCNCHVPTLQEFLAKTFNDSLHAAKKNKTVLMQDLTKYMDVSWNLKPTAHITGSKIQPPPAGRRQGPLYPLRDWEDKGNNCLMQNGMEYRNGRLVVPAKGLYHLYGLLDLHQSLDGNNMTTEMPDSITMRFYRFNILKFTEEMLVEGFRPYQRSANPRFMSYESYLGADVPLEAGDEVYMKVSNPNYIKNPSRNVFGLHML